MRWICWYLCMCTRAQQNFVKRMFLNVCILYMLQWEFQRNCIDGARGRGGDAMAAAPVTTRARL